MKSKTVKLEIPYTKFDFGKNISIFGRSNYIVSEAHKSDSLKSEIVVKS